MKLYWPNWRQTLLWKIFNFYFQKVSQTIFIPIKEILPELTFAANFLIALCKLFVVLRFSLDFFLNLFLVFYWRNLEFEEIVVWWSFSNVQLKVLKVLKPLWFAFSSTFNQFLNVCVCRAGVGKNKHKPLGLKPNWKSFSCTNFLLHHTKPNFLYFVFVESLRNFSYSYWLQQCGRNTLCRYIYTIYLYI